ncbi:phage portal protein [Cellulosimicrobium marinum]|uniref:phage portal protein n=1 Tax=Cellulosimicrobium marinum TaxID=1638992 RepID=UPI001E549248|nr:phage portal protein [Cellulosimicrobium marinum]MCB7135355.1 phage portal protein [Cellulosimicrobium marinum]
MGFLDLFRPNHGLQMPGISGASVQSPWTPSTLSPNLVIADVLGAPDLPPSRAEAMSVPAIAKARHLITTTLARQPLRVFRGEAELSTQPAWLYRTNSDTPPQMRMAYTLDDLFFYGWCLWAVQRGADDQITDAVRVSPDRWSFDEVGRVEVDGNPVDSGEVILIPGPFEGILAAAPSAIRAARNLEQTWAARVRNPIPVVELHITDSNIELSKEEKATLRDEYVQARKNPDGAVVITPAEIELRIHGDAVTDLFIQGRNAIALDVARMTGIPATMLDASQVQSSLTYKTTETGRNDFIDALTNMWAMPIEAQLSMDNVVPRGQRVAFDMSNLLAVPQATTGPDMED